MSPITSYRRLLALTGPGYVVVAGGIADRVGQRPVVMAQALMSSIALVVLVALLSAGAALAAVLGPALVGAIAVVVDAGGAPRPRWPTGNGQSPRVVAVAS